MPIRRLLDQHTFSPEEVEVLVAAYESALAKLKLIDRSDPATALVAKTIILLARRGLRDADRLSDLAVQSLTK
jgi:hypothetical protein